MPTSGLHYLRYDILLPMKQRLGVFGGTFDPPHLGHLILASEACAALSLARVLWVLTSAPPHKLDQEITPVKDRLAMVRLALRGEPAFQLSTVDMDRPGPHYTLDTIKLLSAQYPGDEMVLLIGGDSLHDLPTWHRPAELVDDCAEIGVMRRPGDLIDLTGLEAQIPGLSAKVKYVDAPLLEIASHEIRRLAAAGLPFRYYVLPSIYKYIIDHRLYRGA
jgi:nicotinate-nucleotide adenylyltransferase